MWWRKHRRCWRRHGRGCRRDEGDPGGAGARAQAGCRSGDGDAIGAGGVITAADVQRVAKVLAKGWLPEVLRGARWRRTWRARRAKWLRQLSSTTPTFMRADAPGRADRR